MISTMSVTWEQSFSVGNISLFNNQIISWNFIIIYYLNFYANSRCPQILWVCDWVILMKTYDLMNLILRLGLFQINTKYCDDFHEIRIRGSNGLGPACRPARAQPGPPGPHPGPGPSPNLGRAAFGDQGPRLGWATPGLDRLGSESQRLF